MWMFAIYCVGVFNMCQGVYYTESNPRFSRGFDTRLECEWQAAQAARKDAVEYPGKDIRWRCIDADAAIVTQDK